MTHHTACHRQGMAVQAGSSAHSIQPPTLCLEFWSLEEPLSLGQETGECEPSQCFVLHCSVSEAVASGCHNTWLPSASSFLCVAWVSFLLLSVRASLLALSFYLLFLKQTNKKPMLRLQICSSYSGPPEAKCTVLKHFGMLIVRIQRAAPSL